MFSISIDLRLYEYNKWPLDLDLYFQWPEQKSAKHDTFYFKNEIDREDTLLTYLRKWRVIALTKNDHTEPAIEASQQKHLPYE